MLCTQKNKILALKQPVNSDKISPSVWCIDKKTGSVKNYCS